MCNPGCSEGNTHPDIARIHTQYVSTRAGVRGRSYQQAGYDKDATQCWQGAGLEMSAHIVEDVHFWRVKRT
jgi:hypothetical protein